MEQKNSWQVTQGSRYTGFDICIGVFTDEKLQKKNLNDEKMYHDESDITRLNSVRSEYIQEFLNFIEVPKEIQEAMGQMM